MFSFIGNNLSWMHNSTLKCLSSINIFLKMQANHNTSTNILLLFYDHAFEGYQNFNSYINETQTPIILIMSKAEVGY